MTILGEDQEKMVDMKDVDDVEILFSDGKIWVNVDGKCRLRIQGIRSAVSMNTFINPRSE